MNENNLRKKNKKNKVIIAILLLIAIIGVGYATLGANLKINGVADIPAATWNVHFKEGSIVPTEGSVTIDTDAGQYAPTITNATQLDFAIKLALPGDFYEFTVDVENTGTIDAMIESVSSKLKINDGELQEIIATGENKNLPDYLDYSIAYSDGIPITEKQLLAANGGTETIKVRLAFKTDIEATDLPGSNQTLSFNLLMNYVQKDSTAIEVAHPQIQSTIPEGVYLVSDTQVDEGVNDSGSGAHDSFSQLTYFNHNTVINGKSAIELAMAQWSNITGIENDTKPIFLRLTLGEGTTSGELDVPVEGYIGFIITDDMVAQARNDFIENCNDNQSCIDGYQGMTTGTYYLKAWVDESDEDGENRVVYNANKATLLTAFGRSNCNNNSSCMTSDIHADLNYEGYLKVTDYSSSGCFANTRGYLVCRENI